MNSFEGVEKAAAEHEAREAVGRPQRHTSRTDQVKAALTHYLTTEAYRERAASSPAAKGGERQDSDESS